MKIIIRHLLYERWDGPCIGINIKTKRYTTGAMIRVPQCVSNILLKLDGLYHK